MAALDFPVPTTVGQIFAAPNGASYLWDGVRWTFTGQTALPFVQQAMSAEDNFIINGGMEVSQRATSWASIPSTQYTLDRWKISPGAGNTVAASQGVPSPGAPTTGEVEGTRWSSAGIARTVTGANPTLLFQLVENVRTGAGQTVTVSFDVNTTNPSTLMVGMNQVFGTGGSPSTQVSIAEQSFSAAGTVWERRSLTFALPSISGKTLGTNNDHVLSVYFDLPVAAGNQTFQFTNVDLRLGTVAPAQFLRRPMAEELALCQRYYETLLGDIFASPDASLGRANWNYHVRKRAVPAITLVTSNGSAIAGNYQDTVHVTKSASYAHIGNGTSADAEL